MAGIRNGIAATRRLAPEACAENIEVAGGLVAFTGIESPLSEAFGVGSLEPVSQEQVALITSFYESRGTAPRVFVTPLSDPTLGRALADAGYAPVEYENVLATDDLRTHGRHDARIGIARDLDAWAAASARAFVEREALEPGEDLIARILAQSEGVLPLEARDGGEIAATAAMDVCGEWSACFAGSTLPPFRRRGWHEALVRDRIARAHEAGAQFMRATARPASASERNFHRCGFRTLYTRALWERKLGARR